MVYPSTNRTGSWSNNYPISTRLHPSRTIGHPPPLDGGGSKDIMDHCNGTIDQAPITAYMGEIAPTPTPT